MLVAVYHTCILHIYHMYIACYVPLDYNGHQSKVTD